MVACGDEEGYVKLFETSSRRNLRAFEGHTAPVHRTFFTADKLHIASFSDDQTVRLWDIPSEKCVTKYEQAHDGHIRAGCVSPVSPNILLSGGYDEKVKMYDTRTESAVFEVDHGSQVHSVIFLPTGGIFISCGNSHVKLWDAFAGGHLIAMLSTHNKPITCLRLACNGRRLLSGAMDRKVKIYDTTTYQTVHSLDFPNGITSMAVSPDDDTLVVGMVDGLISVQRMDTDRKIKTLEKRKVPKTISSADQYVPDHNPGAEAKHLTMLKKYNYIGALKAVLTKQCTNQTPHITVGLMKELMRRKGLGRALSGLDDDFLVVFISFLIRYIGDRRFLRDLIGVSNVLLDLFEDDFANVNIKLAKKFMELNKALKREESLLIEFLELEGYFEMLFSGSNVAEQSADVIEYGRDLNKLEPSKSGEEALVVRIEED